MNNILGQSLFSVAIITQITILGSLYSSSAEAAPRCSIRNLVEESSQASTTSTFKINTISGVEKIKLKVGTIKKLKTLLADSDITMGSSKIKDIIELSAETVKGRARNPSIEKADKMAELGRKLLKIVNGDLTKDQVKMVTYMIAEAVMRLETIKTTEYQSGTELPVFKKKSTIHINKLHDLAESYIDGTSMYRDLPQDGGFLSWPEIRGLYTNNSWSIGIRDHDMYHIHYSYGHPYYLAVNMHSSRTINDRRYLMISSLWEAVDTFRTGYESAIATFVQNKRMTVEEGMLFIGSATEKELDAIEREIGSHDQVRSYNELSYQNGWRPNRTKFGRRTATPNQEVYLQEITDFINTSIEKLKQAGNKKYANYHRRGPGQTSDRDEAGVAGY